MKKVFLILSAALVIVSCNKLVATEQTVTADSLLICVLQSIFDSTRSCVEVKDEFIMFFDTMQSHVQSHPDYEIRVGAKSLAMELAGIMLESDLCSPEEVQFFCEELLARYVNLRSTWHLNEYAVEDTFLKYLPFNEYCQTARSVNPILFLKFAAKNPKLTERLWKCGFRELVEEMVVRKSRLEKLINWKCTEIKKALGFNSEEMRYWKSVEGDRNASDKLYAYMLLKKAKGINSLEERLKIIREDGTDLIEKEIGFVVTRGGE